ncbi:MAG: Oxidoreductase family, NAD-binding Rossmann fold [Verrucomicrobia bacterium]|jgi:predicted dehydrogenase|nr:Oxidoreductase family, NAD-binding Rossmann fold [Verrucomicrobiota bacterium]
MKARHLLALAAFLAGSFSAVAADLKVGIIGTDTSHVPAFTKILNVATNKDHVAGAKVVAAFKGGSPDITNSWMRVEKYAEEIAKNHGVKIYDSIEEMSKNVDAVLLESLDGRPHLAQATPVIKAGKPLFIDKPMAASLKDAIAIFELAKKHKVPVFSASSLRFGKDTIAVRNGSIGKVLSAETTSPASLHPTHPDLFWYGIHGVESLFTVMGTGCETVERTTTADGKIKVTGTWKGGRKGTFTEDKGYGGKAIGEKGESPVGKYDGYAALVKEIVPFFQTGKSPVPMEETIEILAFMEAADASKAAGGKPVKIADIIQAAKK